MSLLSVMGDSSVNPQRDQCGGDNEQGGGEVHWLILRKRKQGGEAGCKFVA